MIASNGTGSIYAYLPLPLCECDVFQHNSINVSAGSTNGWSCRVLERFNLYDLLTPGCGNVMKNNIIVNAGGGYALEASSRSELQAPTSRLITTTTMRLVPLHLAPGSSTLSAWQTTSSQDANSVWGDPLFVSATICTFKAPLRIMRALLWVYYGHRWRYALYHYA